MSKIILKPDAILNPLTRTDSYKQTHWLQHLSKINIAHTYFESRKGAKYPETVFFTLQYIMAMYLAGEQVTEKWIRKAKAKCLAHFGTDLFFNEDMFQHIRIAHQGKYPLKIRSVAEGTPVPINNILFNIENTDELCAPLANFIEPTLMKVWYGSTVASKSRNVKKKVLNKLEQTAMNPEAALSFMLHDFGARGGSSEETIMMGGAAHMINFMGSDTMKAMDFLEDFYYADITKIAYSVFATEHSTMTQDGEEGERLLVEKILKGIFDVHDRKINLTDLIVSMVADSYNYYRFVEQYICQDFKHLVLARTKPTVIRPDSITDEYPTPESLMVWTMSTLWEYFGGETNKKGYKVIANGMVKVLWGDGIDEKGIDKIMDAVIEAGYSIENIATFGMGGGLLQKVNRDTQRNAIKCSAKKTDEGWFDVQKNPLDQSKASKKGRLELVKLKSTNEFATIRLEEFDTNKHISMMHDVFENGEILKVWTLDEIRENAKL